MTSRNTREGYYVGYAEGQHVRSHEKPYKLYIAGRKPDRTFIWAKRIDPVYVAYRHAFITWMLRNWPSHK